MENYKKIDSDSVHSNFNKLEIASLKNNNIEEFSRTNFEEYKKAGKVINQ